MKVKIIEIRDEGTFIAALCVDMNPDNSIQRYYLRRYGFPCDNRSNILITHANCDGSPATNDPYWQRGRTWRVAHNYIIEHWHELEDGSVVDVSFILGESKAPKISERLEPQL